LSDIDYARAEGVAGQKNLQQFFIDQWEGSAYHDNSPLKIAGEEYAHGFGMDLGRAYTNETGTIYYNLDGKYSKLTGYVGIDDNSKNSTALGYVTIYGDDTQIYKSEGLVGGNHALPVDLSVEGVAKLKIEFSFTNDDTVNTVSIDFVEAKLVQ
jgi:hypothetical protein